MSLDEERSKRIISKIREKPVELELYETGIKLKEKNKERQLSHMNEVAEMHEKMAT